MTHGNFTVLKGLSYTRRLETVTDSGVCFLFSNSCCHKKKSDLSVNTSKPIAIARYAVTQELITPTWWPSARFTSAHWVSLQNKRLCHVPASWSPAFQFLYIYDFFLVLRISYFGVLFIVLFVVWIVLFAFFTMSPVTLVYIDIWVLDYWLSLRLTYMHA